MSTTTQPADFTDAHAEAVQKLWFDGVSLSPTAPLSQENLSRWFRPDPAFDTACGKFLPLLSSIATTHTPSTITTLATTPRRTLALVLLLDQLPRNIFRSDSSSVYKIYDPLASALARYATDPARRLDAHGGVQEKIWFGVPLMHSENLELHNRGIEMAEELASEASEEQKEVAMKLLASCKEHRDVLKRWGRYPYRNKVMGRESTQEEKEWLEGDEVPMWARSA